MRRSSRLRRKTRVDYSEQAQFEKGSGVTQKQWENITEKGGKARPQRGPLADPLFQPQQLFRKRIPKKQPAKPQSYDISRALNEMNKVWTSRS